MMTAPEIRQKFIEFFRSKQHTIVPSAPMVVKDDPSLMFTNAGMNQFKDIFLGNTAAKSPRVSNSQKCLRVSGKHNDLEEVGKDTYHHTMFEMLGNWSFGDYFKEEAISWAWELLTEVFKLDKDRLYVTIFEGDNSDGLDKDKEAADFWKRHIAKERILLGNKKDNFWEMGESGPCGPCSEIHIDLRPQAEREKISGADLVNQDHPLVIEVWNLVFIEFNRKANGSLEKLPAKHVDTGMGFERLCMAIQGKFSNYDTDVFQPLIQAVAKQSGKTYGKNETDDIAMRVVADHLRAIAFAIADGQLPSNTGAGYVIRRILRRAVRYGYSFLGFTEAFIYQLVDILEAQMGKFFPELKQQKNLIVKVIKEEESAFFKTLSTGIQRLEKMIEELKAQDYKIIKGKEVFELYDTFGFPFDLTELIAEENAMQVSKREFDEEMQAQKERSKQAAQAKADDWVVLQEDEVEEFIGYDHLESDIQITKYRKIATKNSEYYQLVFSHTPFYAESGGQVGDTGYIEHNGERTSIFDTKKENNLIIHFCKQLPKELNHSFKAVVNADKRERITCNHSATHLLHHALRQVLGAHVEQKGSLVDENRLRFDFSHFQRMEEEEIKKVEQMVNDYIRRNVRSNIQYNVPIEEAKNKGAMMLFGEKYGDVVRTVQFADSYELCGGTHVAATGQIAVLKIVHESAIASGIRRIEAVTGQKALDMLNHAENELNSIKALLKNPKEVVKSVEQLLVEQKQLQKALDKLQKEKAQNTLKELKNNIVRIGKYDFLGTVLTLDSASIKNAAFSLSKQYPNLVLTFGQKEGNKAMLTIAIGEEALKKGELSANNIIREAAKEIQGGGGGQKHFATAGGKNPEGIEKAIAIVKSKLETV